MLFMAWAAKVEDISLKSMVLNDYFWFLERKIPRWPPRAPLKILKRPRLLWPAFYYREYVLGWLPIMSNKESFGGIASKKFSIGDIVEWSTWDDIKQDWEHNYGIITDIRNEIRHNRLVSITTVAPLQGPKKEIEHFSLSLRLVSKTGVENVNS